MRLRALIATAALLAAFPAAAFENELLGKRDVDVPEYKSEQGALLFDSKGVETEFLVDYGSYKKNFVILLARAVTDAVWFFYLFWLPGYFQEARGFDLGLVGTTLWIPYFAADIGALGGAWLSSGLIQRGFSLSFSRKAVLLPASLLVKYRK